MSAGSDDTRIVNMRINNKDFLKGASDSLKAVDTLNKGIDKAGKTNGGLKNMAADVDTVKTRFSAMQIAGVTALATITNKAVNAGLRLVKSLTISPIMDGFREYEKLLTSTQTIIANTGKSATTAGRYLDALNAYSDETVYNFGQMADNIGRFTAAGVELKDATTSIKGLANAAALGGSTTEQLNTAMYQTSQALASGVIRLQDWNSLSQAGLGGQNIQQALMSTAKTITTSGPKMDAAIKKYGTFRDSLRSGWLTGDVFNKTMKVMAGQTLNASTSVTNLRKLGLEKTTQAAIRAGDAFKFTTKDVANLKKNGFDDAAISSLELGKSVAYSVKRLKDLGYSDEAAKKLHKLSGAAIDSATKIKTFSQLMDVLREAVGSGFAGIFRQLFGNLEESGKLWTSVGDVITTAISKFFRAISLALGAWRKLKDTQTGMNGYQLAWAAIGNVFKAVGNILRPFAVLLGSLLPSSDKAGSGLFSLTQALYKFSVWLEKVTGNTSKLDPAMGSLGKGVKKAASVIGAAFGIMIKIVGAVIQSYVDLFMIFLPVGQAIGRLADALAVLGGKILETIGIGDGISGMGDAFTKLGGVVAFAFAKFVQIRNAVLIPFVEALVTIIDALTALVSGDIDFGTFKDTLAGAFSGLKVDFGDMLGKGKEAGANLIAGLREGLASGDIKATVSGWVNSFLSFFKGLLGIHSPSTVFEGYGRNIVEGLIAGIVGAAGAIKDAMSTVVNKVKENIGDFDKVDLANIFSIVFSVSAIVTLKRFLDGLGATMTTFKGFAGDIRENVTGKDGILNQTTSTMKTMQTGIRAKAILNIAIAIGILAVSLFLLSKIPAKDLAISLGALAAVMLIFIKGLNLLSKFALTTQTIVPSLFALSAILVILAVGMLLMATALFVFSKVIAVYAKVKWSEIASGLGKMMAVLLGLGVAMTPLAILAPGILIASAALIVLAFGVTAMLGALLIFAKVDLKTIISGMGKLGLVLIALGIAMVPLAAISPFLILAAAGLLVLSVALVALLGVLKAFSAISLGEVFTSVLKIGIALVGLGIAAAIAAVGVIALGVGTLLLGTGLLLAGVGMGLLGAGLVLVAAGGAAAFAALIAGVEAFVAALPIIGVQFVGALNTILDALASRAPQIIDSLVTIIRNLLRGIRELAPDVAETALTLIKTLLQFLIEHEYEFVKAGLLLIGGFIQGLADGLPQLAANITNLVTGLIDALTANIPAFVESGVAFIVAFLGGLGSQVAPLTMAAGQLILDILTAINTAVITYAPLITEQAVQIGKNLILGIVQGLLPDSIYNAFSSLVTNILNFFKGLLGINSPSTVFAGFGRNMLEGLANGISGAFGLVTGILGNLVGNAIGIVKGIGGRIKGALSGLGGILKNAFTTAFNAAVNAISNGVSNIASGMGKIVGKINDVAGKVLTAAKTMGKNVITGIGKGIGSAGNFVSDLAGDLRRAINSGLGLPKTIGFSKKILGKTVSAHVTIPGFAKGVTGFGGGSALVGENGPEVVTLGKGSNVITNENLVSFMKTVSNLTRKLSTSTSTASASTSTSGEIRYVVGADFKGDPKSSGISFAANIVAGLVNGIKANQSSADSAMSALGAGATQSFADILEIKSPSAVFQRLAGFVGQGFVNGLVASTRGVEDAAKRLGSASIGAVLRTISDSNLSFEVSKGVGEAYANAAKLVEKKAGKKGISKGRKRKLTKQAKALDKAAKRNDARAERSRAQADAQEAAIERQAEYDKAYKDKDTSKIADMKKEDALAAAKAASAARQKAIALKQEAKLVEKYDKARAKRLRAQAKKAEAEAKRLGAIAGDAANAATDAANTAAADAANEANEAAADLKAQLTSVTAEQVQAAQKMFEDYSRQLSDVAVAAAADNNVPQVTYNQTINSPEALSPTEVYRNSKNLLSMTERSLVSSNP